MDNVQKHNNLLWSQFVSLESKPQAGGQGPLCLCSPGDRVAQLYPQYRVPFSPPSTTRRATVEVF
jgi:hypothetical protein